MIGINGQDLGLFTPNLKLYQLDANTLSLENLAGGVFKNLKMGDLTLAGGATALTFTAGSTIVAVAGLTMPVFTLGGAVVINGKAFEADADLAYINTTGTEGLRITSTNDGAGVASLTLYHVSANPAAWDIVGRVAAWGKSSVGTQRTYGLLSFQIVSPTDGAETSRCTISLLNAGASVTPLIITNVGLLTITGGITLGGNILLPASGKANPVSGVGGFSVVSTALTLGSLGSVIIPQSAAAATDALAGNVAGAICIDTTGTAEKIYFRGATWFYVAKTGGLSLTSEERLDPNGHEFELGDTIRLVIDKVNADGSFHALPYYEKEELNAKKVTAN